MLNLLVHIVTTGLYRVKKAYEVRDYRSHYTCGKKEYTGRIG
jgi:hypothetical protein